VNRLTREYWGTAADSNESVVHAAELAEQLMVSRDSVLGFLASHIGARNLETDAAALEAGSFAVNCAELCAKTLQAIPASNLPATSDVGCYLPKGATSPKCDIDVSGELFKHVLFEDHNPFEAASKEAPTRGARHQEGATAAAEPEGESEKLQRLLRSGKPNSAQELEQLREMHYPHRSDAQLRIAVANLFRVYPLCNISVAHAESEDSGDPAESTLELGATWEDEVQKVAVQAQVFTSVALRGLNTGKADAQIEKWFGSDSSSSQREVRRVVNGIHSLLSNVDYVYPGSKCGPNTFAYVIPNPPYNKNSRGQYIFNLCDTYIRAHLSEQIETLTHEASHHQTMLTSDVCISGEPPSCTRAYGRSLCQQLANDSPGKAQNNADNFAYFINDMQPNPPRPDCPNYPSCQMDDFCDCPEGKLRVVAKAGNGADCYTCKNVPPVGSSMDTGGRCAVFGTCYKWRGPTDCIDGKCICKQGYHAVRQRCRSN